MMKSIDRPQVGSGEKSISSPHPVKENETTSKKARDVKKRRDIFIIFGLVKVRGPIRERQ